VMLVLQVLMLWLGLRTVDPLADANPFEGLGTAAAIAYVVTAAISLFLGALVAGRLANRVNGLDVLIHGLLTWAVVTLVTLWLAATAAGALIAGALGVVGQAVGAVGGGAAAVAPTVATELEGLVEEQRAILAEFQEELEPLWTDPAARRELRGVVTRIVTDGSPTVREADRQALIDVIAQNTEFSEAEAAVGVDDFIERYEAAQERLAEAEVALREAGQVAAEALSRASMWAFIGLLVGAVIAWFGAWVGAPSTRRETRPA
jgi:hypothetical protein